MRYILCLSALLICACICACSHTPTRPLQNVSLVWKPTSTFKMNVTEVALTRIEFAPFSNSGDQPFLIAENREDASPRPVTTKDDVGVFVYEQTRKIFNDAGWNTVDHDGDVVLSGEVRRFFVEEISTYKGSVILHITARSRAGQVLWDGVTFGTADRFGQSYSAENYYEVLSDSLLDAISSLLSNPDFHKSLMHAG